MPSRSRQIRAAVDSGILPPNTSYCRICMQIKPIPQFSKTTSPNIDKTGALSVCKSCMDILFKETLSNENGSIQKAVLKLCRTFNIRYDELAIDSAIKHIESKNSNPEKLFGLYRAKLLIMARSSTKESSEDVDLTYQFNDEQSIKIDETKFLKEEYRDMDELRRFWGKNFEPEEIKILEGKFSDWSKSHSIDTQSERVLLKFICLKEYDIDKAVESGSSTASLMKEFQDLLKTSALSPSSSNAASGGKSMDAFGVWLKEISEFRPEEWVEDKNMYKDVDNIEAYGEKYLTSPMRALVTGSREFTIEGTDSIDEPEGE